MSRQSAQDVLELRALALSSHTEIVRHNLTDQERLDLGRELVQNSIEVRKAKQELDIAKEEYKQVAKPRESRNKHITDCLHLGFEERETAVMNVLAASGNRVEVYDSETGEFLYDRPLRPEERQLKIS